MAAILVNIENESQKLLRTYNLNDLPVGVEELAKKMGIQVLAFDLGKDVSGVLYVNQHSASIGYNPSESKLRQRFTIAHEIGHYVLHRTEREVFIDNNNRFSLVKFRSSGSIDVVHEQQANAFAAAILMPQKIILQEIKNYYGFDLSDNGTISELAKRFEVSIPAMSYRILNLIDSGIINSSR